MNQKRDCLVLDKILWRRWHIVYVDGRVSRGTMSKDEAIQQAQSWNGVRIFSVVKIFGKEYTHIESVPKPEPVKLPTAKGIDNSD